MPVFELPDGLVSWQRRAEWLLRSFQSTAKSTKELLADLLQFANGDTAGAVVTHFCVASQGCCQSDEEALSKFLGKAVPIFSRGFQTPLLYRMKHYGPASSYIKLGCSFFNLLPHVLGEMGRISSNRVDAELSSLVDVFLRDASASGEQVGEADIQHLVADALDADRNFAAQNSIRRNKVLDEVLKPAFHQASMVIDFLVQPLEHGINFLQGHTKLLQDMTYMGRGHPQLENLSNEARQKFLYVMAGKLATSCLDSTSQCWSMVCRNLRQWVSMPLLNP